MKDKIDLVYLWVDGNDKKWQAKRNAYLGPTKESNSMDCKGRYIDNDELKYSLRSVEKYSPWINQIFILTDDQVPQWLDTSNPKIKVIDHKDIIPTEYLPCFSSTTIEHFIYKIPNLSEYFLYSNDDMFINKPIIPDFFFTTAGLPIIRLKRRPLLKLRWFLKKYVRRKKVRPHTQSVANAAKLVQSKYGVYMSGFPHHNMDAYLKSDWKRTAEHIFKNEIEKVFGNRVRDFTGINRILYSYVALAEGRGHLCYITKKESLYLDIHRKDHYGRVNKYNPTLFCLNDNQYAGDKDRIDLKAFLEGHFPEKSSYES